MRTMNIPAGQEAVVSYLMGKIQHSDHRPVEMVETNQSYVFLHGDSAFKLFKAISRYRDNTTPAARLENAQLEMEANQALAGDLYDYILAVIESPLGGLTMVCLDDVRDFKVLDYVVKMNRFDNSRLMYSRLFDGSLTEHDLFDLGAHVAKFHDAQRPQPFEPATYPQIFADDFDHWLKSYAERVPQAECKDIMLDIRDTAAKAIAAKAGSFLQREGMRATLHGDMDFGNIATYNGKLVPFDAQVLFDGKRENDPAKDVAYMLAPLYMYGRPDLAKALIRGYKSVIPIDSLTDVLPLWVAYASMVRGNSWLSKAVAVSTPQEAAMYEAYGYRYLKNMERLLKGEMDL